MFLPPGQKIFLLTKLTHQRRPKIQSTIEGLMLLWLLCVRPSVGLQGVLQGRRSKGMMLATRDPFSGFPEEPTVREMLEEFVKQDDEKKTSWTDRKVLEFRRAEDDVSEVNVSAVEALLKERAMAKFHLDYDRSDHLMKILERDYGVTVDNAQQIWRAGPTRYVRRENDFPLPESLPIDKIDDLILRRDNARRLQQYDDADDILFELCALGVRVNDDGMNWAYLGPAYRQEPDDDHVLPFEDHLKIMVLIEERRRFKLQRRFDQADALQKKLLTQHNVVVDDLTKRWRNVTPETAALRLDHFFADRDDDLESPHRRRR